jgi:hypothetical protein
MAGFVTAPLAALASLLAMGFYKLLAMLSS